VAVKLDEHDGQTPHDPDERAGLKPDHLTTMAELNDWEQENILRAVQWVKKVRSPDVLSEGFCRTLHRKMFDQTWDWAGTFRRTDKNIGCDWTQIGMRLEQVLGNTRWWVNNATFGTDEIAARFHRDLVWVHPFPNGNGRHARMMADALLNRMGQRQFTWGSAGNLVAVIEARTRYLAALRVADHGDYGPLLAFARS
jgi:Fic-DOC domain mobile mystery protein B